MYTENICNGPKPGEMIGFVTSKTEKPAPPLPKGTISIVCQDGSSSNVPLGSNPLIKTSCTIGEPSTPNIALEPPVPLVPTSSSC